MTRKNHPHPYLSTLSFRFPGEVDAQVLQRAGLIQILERDLEQSYCLSFQRTHTKQELCARSTLGNLAFTDEEGEALDLLRKESTTGRSEVDPGSFLRNTQSHGHL